ncbi:MAG TPA: shikimate dehydrogenase [Clostridiales bacterium]|jgi:shikimate dehydrogenase|nr:shikimate dehydrogenase [Clostridiales bacterium]
MKKYALIGENITYSFSHIVHQEIARLADIKLRYDILSVAPKAFVGAVNRLKQGYDGFNITKPYKLDILPFLSQNHSKTQAVNTVKVLGGELIGYNTDGLGFMRSLEYNNIDIDGDCLILGAGGAARTLAYELDKVCNVFIYNRTKQKVFDIINDLKLKNTCWTDLKSLKPKVIINCTTLGLNDEMCLPDEANLQNTQVFYDTIYNPPLTPMLKLAQKLGKTAVNGMGMLFFQALEAQKIWNNINLNQEQISEALENICDKVK